MAVTFKFGIKHDSGVVQSLSIFKNGVVPVGFVEISESDYLSFMATFKANPFLIYDEAKNTLTPDAGKLATANGERDKLLLRNTLRSLSIELDLQTRMGEDTTATQADFDAKKIAYNAM